MGGWILLAADAAVLVASAMGHERAAEALTARLSWNVMPEDPDIARWIGTWTHRLSLLGLAAQAATVWLALRWRRWRLVPAGGPRSRVALAVLATALLWNLAGAAGVVFSFGADGGDVAASVGETVFGWRALLDLGNAGALVAAWRWRPWRQASAASGVS
jgi:hypothetical protein